MINIAYSRLPDEVCSTQFQKYYAQLPGESQEKIGRFVNRQDKLLHLIGKLLLRDALQHFGFDKQVLHEIRYSPYLRPYIPSCNVDFNISHSGNYVLCAIGRGVRLGIDIEMIRTIDLSDFEEVMNADQWQAISGSPDGIRTFFDYWTIKESVIKADSRGMSIPLKDIHIVHSTAECDGNRWFLKQLDIDSNYCCCLATDQVAAAISMEYKNYSFK